MQSDSTPDLMDFDNLMAWLHHNRKPVAIIGTIVVVGLVSFSLYTWNKSQKEVKANAALFSLPSLISQDPAATNVSAQDFQKIADEYPNTQAAERAEIIAAGVLFTNGKYEEAEKHFSEFLNNHPTSELGSEAALGVAASLEARGKVSEAVSKYQELITTYPGTSAIAPAKLTLARLLETQNKPDEALRLYDELTGSQNPYDPWAAEARERRELLLQKNPDLKKKPVASAPTISTNISVVPSAATTTKSSAK